MSKIQVNFEDDKGNKTAIATNQDTPEKAVEHAQSWVKPGNEAVSTQTITWVNGQPQLGEEEPV